MEPQTPYVLIVDDHPAMRSVIKSNLRQVGIENTLEAEDGRGALNILSKHPVNCIISDWNMPEMDGLELLLNLRSSPKYQSLLFMMVTAETDRESIQQVISAGVDEFLIKPFTPTNLCEKVQRLLRKGEHGADISSARSAYGGTGSLINIEKTRERDIVLVVDDTPTNIDVITGLIKDEYRIIAATSGAKALQIIEKKPPSLILLDIMMPEMDGMEVCRRLKDNPKTENIPVIFLTAKTEVNDITAGFDIGAVDYITKPVNGKVLKARVRTQLKLKKSRDDLSHQIDVLTENARLREDIERMTQHDLKSPLTAIINTSEQLMENRWLGAEQLHEIDTIRGSAYDILGMVDRSLDLYKMETGQYRLNPKTLDIVAVCQRVLEAERLNAKKKGIKILFESPEKCLCRGEELLCLSMLGNLVKNAVEASPASENIKVLVSEVDEEGSHENREGNEKEKEQQTITLEISNQGVIPADVRDNFFEKYSTSGKDTGTGLGTYSAKLMANIQGGDIRFESTEQTGTCLIIDLPRAKD